MDESEDDMAKGYRAGTAVEFKVGRGWGRGKIESVSKGMAEIDTAGGHRIRRALESLRRPGETPAIPEGTGGE